MSSSPTATMVITAHPGMAASPVKETNVFTYYLLRSYFYSINVLVFLKLLFTMDYHLH